MRQVARTLVAAALMIMPVLAETPAPAPRRRVSSPISFFEDADITNPGMMNISEDIFYGRVDAGRDISVPSTFFSLGLNKRLEVSGGVGYDRSSFEDVHTNGVGDTYFGTKVLLIPQRGWRPALAVKPTMEILGEPSIANNILAPDRVNFLLPVSIQKTFDQFRFYYTIGYLSRGIFFQSLAYELNRWSRVTPTVVLSHSRLTHELGLISEQSLNRSRSDVLGLVAVTINPHWSVYGSVGRSFGRSDVNSTKLQASAGFSVNLRLWQAR